jgi:hypothetical protein
MPTDYLEIKRHKNKPEQRFQCELLFSTAGYAVLRYVSREPGLIADIAIAPGSTTIAHYWQKMPFVAWRMFDSGSLLLGTLFHICTNVCIEADRLSYDDLLLDIWVSPDRRLRVLDEDELQAAIAAGRINQTELSCIRGSQQYITLHHSEIISELVPFDPQPAGNAPPAQT